MTKLKSSQKCSSFHAQAFLLSFLFHTACAFAPGEAFGELRADLAGSIENRGRVTDEGWLQVVGSWEVRLERVEIDIASVDLITSTGETSGTSDASFDPSRPPPGWLCHGDHCHTPDGDTVSLEEAAAMFRGDAEGPSIFVSLPANETLDLLDDESVIDLTHCTPSCQMRRGFADIITLNIDYLHIEGRVRDLQPENRLDAETVPLTVSLATPHTSVTTFFDEHLKFDRGLPPHARLEMELLIQPSLLDGFPFDDLVLNGEISLEFDHESRIISQATEIILENVEASQIGIVVSRTNE